VLLCAGYNLETTDVFRRPGALRVGKCSARRAI
jgi:hypothetical protein